MGGSLLEVWLSFFELCSWDSGIPSRSACNDEQTRSLSVNILDTPEVSIMREAVGLGLKVMGIWSGEVLDSGLRCIKPLWNEVWALHLIGFLYLETKQLRLR